MCVGQCHPNPSTKDWIEQNVYSSEAKDNFFLVFIYISHIFSGNYVVGNPFVGRSGIAKLEFTCRNSIYQCANKKKIKVNHVNHTDK